MANVLFGAQGNYGRQGGNYPAGTSVDLTAAGGQGIVNALRMLQFKQAATTLRDTQTFQQTARQAVDRPNPEVPELGQLQYDPESHAQLLEQAGLPLEAAKLRKITIGTETDRAVNTLKNLQIYTAGLQIIRESANFIASIEDKDERQRQWANLRAGIISQLKIDPSIIPENADPKMLLRLARNAADQLKILTMEVAQPGGKTQQTIVGVNTNPPAGTNPIAFQQPIGIPTMPEAKGGGTPSANEKKARELYTRLRQDPYNLPEDEAKRVSTEVAFGTLIQGTDDRGNVFWIDRITKQPVVTLRKIPGTVPARYEVIHHQGAAENDPLKIR